MKANDVQITVASNEQKITNAIKNIIQKETDIEQLIQCEKILRGNKKFLFGHSLLCENVGSLIEKEPDIEIEGYWEIHF